MSAVSSLTVRPARAGDTLALHALQQTIYAEARWFVGDGAPSADAITRRLRSLDPRHSCYLVALIQPPPNHPQRHHPQPNHPQARHPQANHPQAQGQHEQVSGWLELNRPQPQRLKHVAVLTIAVAPAWRRRGVARQLLSRGYQWAQQKGVKKIQLDVRAGNTAAITLYEREGFVLEGRERAQILTPQGYEDNLVMAKFLDERLLQSEPPPDGQAVAGNHV